MIKRLSFFTMLLFVALVVCSEPARASNPTCNVDDNGLNHCVVGVPVQSFDLTASQHQEQSEWCWAATLSMLFAFQGQHVSQSDVVLHRWGAVANVKSGDYADLATSISGSWQGPTFGPFAVQTLAISPHDLARIAESLKLDEPLMLANDHHVMVLTGLRYTINGDGSQISVDDSHSGYVATVFDPWPPGVGGYPGGRRSLTKAEWNSVVRLLLVVVT